LFLCFFVVHRSSQNNKATKQLRQRSLAKNTNRVRATDQLPAWQSKPAASFLCSFVVHSCCENNKATKQLSQCLLQKAPTASGTRTSFQHGNSKQVLCLFVPSLFIALPKTTKQQSN
jgi:hypothetical protein